MSKFTHNKHIVLYSSMLLVSTLNLFVPNLWTSGIEVSFFLLLTVGEAVFIQQGNSVISAYDQIEKLKEKINDQEKQIIIRDKVRIELEDMLEDARKASSRKYAGKVDIL